MRKYLEFCIKKERFCIKNEEFCISNDEFCRLGLETKTVTASIGLEQEFFLVPRDQYYRRPDLQLTGRTVIGAPAARGQELCDHYMAPINPHALNVMNEIQAECCKYSSEPRKYPLISANILSPPALAPAPALPERERERKREREREREPS